MGLVLEWLERRLGSRGHTVGLVRQRSAELLSHGNGTLWSSPIGLSRAQLAGVIGNDRLSRLSSQFHNRGSRQHLLNIAWYGSVIADVSCGVSDPNRECILREGALFNLAVALYDTTVEEFAHLRPELIAGFDGHRIRDRLEGRTISPLTSAQPALGDLMFLCDSLLSSVRLRLQSTPARLSYLAGLLERMYTSEVTKQGDRRDAKMLPIVFICALGEDVLANTRLQFPTALARWLSLMDDWQDLGRDVWARRANQFVLPQDGLSWHLVPYGIRALHLVFGGRSSRNRTADLLLSSLNDLVVSAEQVGADTAFKTRAFALMLLDLQSCSGQRRASDYSNVAGCRPTSQ